MYLMALCTDTNGYFFSGIVATMLTTAVMLTVLMLALIYMFGQFFRRPEHESFVSIELGQLAVTLLLFLTIFGSTCASAELSERFAGGDPYDIARKYLNYMSNDVAIGEVQWLYFVTLGSQYLGSWTEKRGCSPWGVIMPTFPSFVVIERIAEFLLLVISPFAASLLVQSAIIEAIRGTMLPFVLPAGIVLRLFPPTRDASAFLISTAIAFGIVFPFTYVMHDAIVRPMVAESGVTVSLEERLAADGKEDFRRFINESGELDLDSTIFKPFRTLSFILLQALFLPTLSITVTIAFIKGFTKFLN